MFDEAKAIAPPDPPSPIIIEIFETKPVAILYKNKARYLLDTSSNLILFEDNKNFNQLPTVFGEGAKNHFIHFFGPYASVTQCDLINNLSDGLAITRHRLAFT